jgi:hypothetical protein
MKSVHSVVSVFPRLTVLAAAVAAGIAGNALAQVIAHPNQVAGEVAFTNLSPAVLAILNDPTDVPPGLGYGMEGIVEVHAFSRPPQSPQLYHLSTSSAGSRLRGSYELTVETGPPGAGIAYDVGAWATVTHGRYVFAEQPTAPVEHEPAPDVRRDLGECAGVIKISVEDPSGNPVPFQGGEAKAWLETTPGSGVFDRFQAHRLLLPGPFDYLVVRGGNTFEVVIRFQLGSSPLVDKMEFEISRQLRVECDQVTPLVIRTDTGTGGLTPPRIVGQVDVLGEDERLTGNLTLVRAEHGPWDNERFDHVGRTPSSGAYELPNLMPSNVVSPPVPYQVSALLGLRSGQRFEYFQTPAREVMAPGGPTVDVGDLLVIDPGTMHGDILLAGPPVQNPAIGSALEDMYRKSDEDADGDGVPDQADLLWLGSCVIARGHDEVVPGRALAVFPGDYDSPSASFLGDYELVAGGLDRQAGNYTPRDLYLAFRDQATPLVPLSYLDCRYKIDRESMLPLRLDPGSRHDVPLHYCLSQLNLRFDSIGGSFFDPAISGGGLHAGLDFEGNDLTYRLPEMDCRGTPPDGPGVTQGLVVAPLPQAEYMLYPSITAVNPGGGTSFVLLQPIALSLGCRQVVDAWLDFQLGLVAPRACTSRAEADFAGQVTGIESIDRIEYVLNGAPPTVVCAPCGVAPAYAFTVPLQMGNNVIILSAHGSTGRVASVRSEIERVPVPGAIGNDLRAIREGADARFYWQLAADSVSTEVWRDADKAFLRPVRRWIAPVPAIEGVDAGVVPPGGGPLFHYRVRGLNCAGEPGP